MICVKILNVSSLAKPLSNISPAFVFLFLAISLFFEGPSGANTLNLS